MITSYFLEIGDKDRGGPENRRDEKFPSPAEKLGSGRSDVPSLVLGSEWREVNNVLQTRFPEVHDSLLKRGKITSVFKHRNASGGASAESDSTLE
jgi:hypothetical protein